MYSFSVTLNESIALHKNDSHTHTLRGATGASAKKE